MHRRDLFLILVGAILIAMFASGSIISDAQISPQPTPTFTPIGPAPTDTPFPPTPTDTPFPPTPTDTPFPPTNTPPPPTKTPTPLPLPPEVGPITIDLPQALVAVDVPLNFTLSFTEPIPVLDTVTWFWGDGTTSNCPPNSAGCTVDWPAIVNSTSTGSQFVNGTVTGSHAYSDPGVYTVLVMVEDISGQSDTATYEFVVVYDPGAGFVTGGGWIDSPAGAYRPDPTLVGKATFGFVSKYKKGSSRPTGNTEFQFKVADLNFHSDTYHWLVVNQGGTNAQFRGEGTINGAGFYVPCFYDLFRFMIWAKDGQASGADDTFRIRIWLEDECSGAEIDIYDNGYGNYSQAIGEGNITVHSPSKQR